MKTKLLLIIILLFFTSSIIVSADVFEAGYSNEMFYLTYAYYNVSTGNIEEAVKIFEKLIESEDEKIKISALRELIQIYDYMGVGRLVRQYLDKYFEITEEDYFPHLYQGILYLKTDNYEEAKKSIEKSFELNPDVKELSFYLGSVYYATENYDTAIFYFERFLLYNPPVPTVLLNLGKLYFIQEEYEKTVKFLNDYISMVPLNQEAYFILGTAYENLGYEEKSIKTYEKAVHIMPDNELVVRKLIMYYFENRMNDKFKELILYLNKFNLFSLDDLMTYSLLGVEIGEYDFTLEIVNFIISVRPDLFEAYVVKSFILEKKFMFKQALNNYSRALQIRPNALEIYFAKGKVYEILDDYKNAYETYKKAIEIRSFSTQALFLAASVNEKMGEYEKAEEYFIELLKINPEHTSALNYLGYMYAEQNINIDTASKLIRKALELQPKNHYYLDSLAWVYYRKGQYEQAYMYIQESIKYAVTEEAVIYEHYGDICIKLNKIDEAIDAYKHSLDIKNDDSVQQKLDAILNKIN